MILSSLCVLFAAIGASGKEITRDDLLHSITGNPSYLIRSILNSYVPSGKSHDKIVERLTVPMPGVNFNLTNLQQYPPVTNAVMATSDSSFLTYSFRDQLSCLPSKPITTYFGIRTGLCLGAGLYDDDYAYSVKYHCNEDGKYFTIYYGSNDCTGSGTTYDFENYINCDRYDDRRVLLGDDVYDDDDSTIGMEFTCETSPEMKFESSFWVTAYYDDFDCKEFSFFAALRADHCFGYSSLSFKYVSDGKKYQMWDDNGKCKGSPAYSYSMPTGGCYGGRRLFEEVAADDASPDPVASSSKSDFGTSISESGTVTGSNSNGDEGFTSTNLFVYIMIAVSFVVFCCLLGIGYHIFHLYHDYNKAPTSA